MPALSAALGAAGVAVALLAAFAGRRPPAAPVPDFAGYLARWSELHGGFDASAAPVTGTWLRLVYRCARPPARAGVAPDVLTLAGVWTSALLLPVAVAGRHWLLLAGLVVVISGLADNLDGAVAVLTARVTRFGYVLDSVADRLSDGLYLGALYLAGASGPLCVAAGAATGLLEYIRARAGAAGMAEIGVLTPGERPTRIILAALALCLAGADPGRRALCADAGAAATAVLTAASACLLLAVVRRRLTGAPPGN